MKKIFLIGLLVFCGSTVFAQFEDADKYAETITQDDLRDYLSILASDAMEGRETGERGQKMAAAFIAYHFEKIGLEPVVETADGKSYFQEFYLEKSEPGETYVSAGDGKIMNGEGLVYWGSNTTDGEVSAEAVITNLDNFKNTDLSGKAAFIYAPGTGLRAMSGQLEEIYAKNPAVTFVVLSKDQADVDKMISAYKRYFMSSRLGFASKVQSGGAFLISQEMAAKLLDVKAEKFEATMEAYANGDQKGVDKLKLSDVTYRTSRHTQAIRTENVLGYLEGTDRKDEVIIVTAHYDHVGRNGESIYNGADDDGSGTSAIMEMAQAYAEAKKAGIGPRRSMLFMTVTGEEKGLLGSSYYTENPIFPLDKTVANLNIDMIGRHDPQHEDNQDFVYLVGSDKLSTELHQISEMTNTAKTKMSLDYTYNDEDHPDRIYYRSDHWNFAKNNVPVIFYFSGIHADYHKETDTIEKIEFDMLHKRTLLVYYTSWVLANRDDRIVVDVPSDTKLESGN